MQILPHAHDFAIISRKWHAVWKIEEHFGKYSSKNTALFRDLPSEWDNFFTILQTPAKNIDKIPWHYWNTYKQTVSNHHKKNKQKIPSASS